MAQQVGGFPGTHCPQPLHSPTAQLFPQLSATKLHCIPAVHIALMMHSASKYFMQSLLFPQGKEPPPLDAVAAVAVLAALAALAVDALAALAVAALALALAAL